MTAIFTDLEVLGRQEPRICAVPPYDEEGIGQEAVELAASAGLHLDAWEEFVLRESLHLQRTGRFAAMEVGVQVSRQNGKGAILEARALVALFLQARRDMLVIHSAHQFDTSMEAMRRLLWLVESTPDLDRQVKKVSNTHGGEGIELRSGARIRFRTRARGGGRGFSCDLLILDEAMFLPEHLFGNVLSTLSARPNPQIWYTGSAVDQDVHHDGIVFARARERGHAGDDPRLLWAEWSEDGEDPSDVDEDVLGSTEAWAKANPGLGIRITTDFVEMERRAMDARTFAVERLGIGDWPTTEQRGVISMQAWRALTDKDSRPGEGPLVFAFDVSPDRKWSTIAVAAMRDDGLTHLEVVDRRPGTDWVVGRLVDLVETHEPDEVYVDPFGPAGSLLPALTGHKRGFTPVSVSGPEHAQGCGLLVDAVEEGTVRHLGTPELASAIKGAVKRSLGEAWAWSRKSSSVDITPVVACTLALWGLGKQSDAPMIQVFR